MIDKETMVFNAIKAALRTEFTSIFIIGKNITSTPSSFPAVSVVMETNSVNKRYMTFGKIENVAIESYKFEIYSNLIEGGVAETKAIAAEIDSTMASLGYVRKFNEPISNVDPSISRRIVRYEKNNVI